MQLTVMYVKEDDGKIRATLAITDKADYPTDKIFGHSRDYPSADDFQLCAGDCHWIMEKFHTTVDVTNWVSQQIFCLQKHLVKWREINVPKEETYTI